MIIVGILALPIALLSLALGAAFFWLYVALVVRCTQNTLATSDDAPPPAPQKPLWAPGRHRRLARA